MAKFQLALLLKPYTENAAWSIEAYERHLKKLQLKGVQWGPKESMNVVYEVNALRVMCEFDSDVTSEMDICQQVQHFMKDDIKLVEIEALNKVPV